MRTKKVTGVLIAFMIISTGIVYGKGPGTTGAAFLKIGVGARAVALGESYVAIADDASTLYWNPAGLSNITGSEVILQHNQWLSQISQEYVGYVCPVGSGKIGIGVNYLHMDPIERTLEDNSGNYGGSKGTFKAADTALSLGYSRAVSESLSIGVGLKGIRQRIDTETAQGVGLDVGTYYQTPIEGLSIGIVIQNPGSKIKFIEQKDSLPLNYRVGTALRIKEALLSIDVNKPIENDLRFNTGFEYTIMKVLSLRLGYNSKNYLDKGLTYGVGVNMSKVKLDYAFVPYGDLGDTHRVSMSVHLP